MPYKCSVLSNGLTVVSEHVEGVRSVSLGIWVNVGSRDESPAEYGISHFIEHMLFKGTPTRNSVDISRAFDNLGAYVNAFTTREHTCFYSQLVDKDLDTAFELLADMVVNPLFDPADIEPERQVVLEELAQYEDCPEDLVWDVFYDAMFPTHPLGRLIVGTRESLAGFSHDPLSAFHKRNYCGRNIHVVASGNLDHQQLVELAEKYLGNLDGGEARVRLPFQELHSKEMVVVQRDTEQAQIVYGMPGFVDYDPKRFAYSLVENILGGSSGSRLFEEIREKRGLVYDVCASSQPYSDAGVFHVNAGTNPENISEIISIMRDEFSAMAEKGVTEDELTRAKNCVCGNLVLAMESTRSRMTRLGRMSICGRELRSLDQTLESYRQVGIEEVNDAARELLCKKPTIAIVGPLDERQVEGMV